MPKVSIILPNYNHEKFISERIDSILSQDFEDFELIILDDASTDGSVVNIQKYLDDPRVIDLFLNDSNSGSTFSQWQKGLYSAQGEYIWIAESDDIAKSSFLSEMVKVLDKSNNIGVAFCPSVWINEEGREVHRPSHEKEEEIWSGSSLVINELLIGNLIYNASSAVFRRELLSRANFEVIKNFKYTGDWMFWVQVVAKTQVMRLEKRLNFFRRHSNNVSSKSEMEGLQYIEGIKIAQYIFKNHKVSFSKKRKTMIFWAKKLLLSDQQNKTEVLKRLPFEMRFWYKFLKFISF